MDSKVPESSTQDVFRLSRDLKRLRDSKELLEATLKDTNKEIDTVNEELVKLMVDAELQRFSLEGTLYYLSTDLYVSALADTQEELYEALRKEGYGDLIRNTVPYQTLKGFVKEMIGENSDELPVWLKPFVSVFQKDKVKMMRETRK